MKVNRPPVWYRDWTHSSGDTMPNSAELSIVSPELLFDILSLRQDCPNFASVSGSGSLLDGTSQLVAGSFCLNQPHQDFLINSRL